MKMILTYDNGFTVYLHRGPEQHRIIVDHKADGKGFNSKEYSYPAKGRGRRFGSSLATLAIDRFRDDMKKGGAS